MVKKSVGRPPKFNIKVANKVADLVAYNYSVSDGCRYAKISKSTYYYYLNNEPFFADLMAQAYENRRKVNFNFRTIY